MTGIRKKTGITVRTASLLLFAIGTQIFGITSPSYSATAELYTSSQLIKRQLSLENCFKQADLNNKEILVAASSLPVAQASIVIARAIPNPTFNLEYGWGPAWQYIIAGNNQQFGFTEEIQVAGKRTKKVAVAKSNFFLNALQIEAIRFDVHNRVRRAYADLAATESSIELLKKQREIAQKLQDLTKNRYDAGKVPGTELMQAKLATMQFSVLLNTARGKRVQGTARLAQLLGETSTQQEIIDVEDNGLFDLSSSSSILTPDFTRELPPLQKLLPLAWQQRKDLNAAIQQAYANRKALTLAKTMRIPDPVIGFQYLFSSYKSIQPQYFNPNAASSSPTPDTSRTSDHSTSAPSSNSSVTDSSGSDSSGASNTGSINAGPDNSNANSVTASQTQNPPVAKVPYQPGYLLTVSQETPIFNQYKGQINQANAVWQQQQKQNEYLYSKIAADIVTSYESVQLARKNIATYQRNLIPAAEKVAQLSRSGYELGKIDLAAALLAQQQYQQTRAAYFDAIAAYQNAWADLELATGVPLKL